MANSDETPDATGAGEAIAGGAAGACTAPVTAQFFLSVDLSDDALPEADENIERKSETISASELIVADSSEYEGREYEASMFSRSAPEGGDQRLIVDALTGAASKMLLMCATGRPRELDAHSATSRGILAVSEVKRRPTIINQNNAWNSYHCS